ncbi:hypothetical protein AGOR_G00034660 [Albula goreensis]|uniref:THAP-type domain-containing protein n=1 Tax=Albula goreensis TaxID=1534307 RepID=A0A8T3DYM7_9TELE|nr:hypothetical protein AGOR_G00034660 [Albula goreensis]
MDPPLRGGPTRRTAVRKTVAAIFVRSRDCVMPRHCSAAGCKSRDTRETRKAGITFHRLPKRGKPRRTLWILNSRRTGPQGKGQWDPQSHFIYFCSKHFTPESFELSGVSGYRRLKEDALPTVFETLPRPRRAASEKAQRGRSKQATTKRPTRKQALTLKPGKEEEKQEQVSVPEGWVGEDCPDTDSESAGKEVKSEGARWEEDRKTEGGAGTQVETLPPAPSHLPSSLPHTSPMSPQILPPSPPTLSTKPLPSPSPSPSETTSSSRPRPPSPPANPPSPSRYMRRLPPPPGFYLPREHNYAQLCPLVWRKRYERAIDTLEKSVRLLNAARRRENRLRHTLLRLRESRIRQNFRDGLRCGNEVVEGSGSAPSSWERRIHWQEVEENDMGRAEEDLRLIEDGLGEKGGCDRRAPPVRAALEEDAGFCFYCGRGWSEGEEEQEHQGEAVKTAMGRESPGN